MSLLNPLEQLIKAGNIGSQEFIANLLKHHHYSKLEAGI
jgi:hypothetical protein